MVYETCSRCDYTTYEELEAGHRYVSTVIPPTLESEGYTEHVCSGCDDTYRDNYVEKLDYVIGDTDGNEGVDKDDAIHLLMHTFFPDEYPVSQDCDFDNNGTVDKDDAIYLLMYMFFPDEYPINTQNTAVYAYIPARQREDEE